MLKLLILFLVSIYTGPALAKYLEDITMINAKKLSKMEVFNLARQVKFTVKQSKIITCIAEKESRFRTKAVNKRNTNKTKDYGLLQINSIWLKTCDADPNKILHPVINMKCAKQIHEIQGFKAWVVYNKFKKTCYNYKLGS